MKEAWHVDAALMERYAAGDLADPAALSIETHLVRCAECQAAAASQVDAGRLDSVWRGVEDLVDVPHRTRAERLLQRLGVAEPTARLLAVTPSLRAPWIATVGLLLTISILGGFNRSGQRSDLLLLILAPVIPVVGTASVFGSRTDVTGDLTMASPVSSLWLVLVRTASVLLTSITLAGCASLLAPELSWTVLGWLVPALALTTATLALASRLRPASAAAIVATVWLVGVVGNEVVAGGGFRGLRADGPVKAIAFHPTGQLALFLVALLATLVVALRRDSFEIEVEGLW